jgi:hypothetical protein
MALVPCRLCRQPFYASCADASCLDALCPYCEYGEERESALSADAVSIATADVVGADMMPATLDIGDTNRAGRPWPVMSPR